MLKNITTKLPSQTWLASSICKASMSHNKNPVSKSKVATPCSSTEAQMAELTQ